ncbi:MAG: iron ABC transporter permease, partial [Betaproteobacteria bacterium]
MSDHRRALTGWLLCGAVGFLLTPWYALQDTVLGIAWIGSFTSKDNAPALLQSFMHGRVWLAPVGVLLLASATLLLPALLPRVRANALIAVGAAGFSWVMLQGFAIVPAGWASPALGQMFGAIAGKQFGMGLGAALVCTAFGMMFALGLAGRGFFKGDAFVASSVVAVGVLVAVFTFFPVYKILIQAVENADGVFSLPAFFARLFTEKIWGVGCIVGNTRCGVAWNTLILA